MDPPGIEPGSPATPELVSSRWTMSPFIQWTGRGVEPRSPGCKPGSRPVGRSRPFVRQRSVRELNPAFGLTKDGVRPKHLQTNRHQVIPDGIEPSLSWMSARRLSRWTTGSFSDQRWESNPQTRGSRPRRFASLRTRSVKWRVRGSHPTGQAYEARLSTGSPASIQVDQGESRTPMPQRARRSERRVYPSSTTWL